MALSPNGDTMVFATGSTSPNVVCISTNYGRWWTVINGNTNGLPTGCGGTAAAISPASASFPCGMIFFNAYGNYAYYTTNYGTNWINTVKSGADNIIISNDSTKILMNGGGTLYLSTNSAASWTTLTAPVGPSSIGASSDLSNIYIISGAKVYKSVNLGVSWTNVSGTSSTSYLSATNTFNHMATSQNGQLILAGHNSSGYLYLSTNRGNTWSIQNNSLSANWYTASMSATNGQFMLAGNNSFLYLSTNTGATWQPISGSAYGSTYGLFTTTGNWSSSAISNAGQYMLAGMNTGSLYLSTSSGSSWTLLGGAANTNGMPTSAANWSSCSMNASGSLMTAAVGTSGSIYLSTNSGAYWSKAPGLSTSAPWSKVSIASSANYVVASANSGNIYLSTDGAGATWSQKSGTIGNPIMVASGEGTNSLAYSYDGITWTGVGTGFLWSEEA